MPAPMLSKNELNEIVLSEIRKREGCEGVNAVVILETRDPRSAANWVISIVVAENGDPAAVQQATAYVQRHLQARYRLEPSVRTAVSGD
jgi:hypothetical protein